MINPVIILCIIIVLMSCTTMKVTTENEPSIDFSVFKTYRWSPTSEKKQQSYSSDYEFLDTRIRQAVDKRLAAKGYTQQVTETPDFFIRYRVWLQTRVSDDEHAHWGDWDHRIGPMDESRRPTYSSESNRAIRQQKEGTLLLIIADGQTNRLIWRGSAQTRVNQSESPQKTEEKINEAVKLILARFPPN